MSVAAKRGVLALCLFVWAFPAAVYADSVAYKAMQKQSNLLYKAGKHEQSLALSLKLLKMAKAEFGEQHIETAMQNFGIGFNLIALKRPAEAVPYYQKHLTIKEKVYGDKAIGLQFPLNHLAGLYKHLGQLDKAEALYQRVRTIQQAATGSKRFAARVQGDIASVNLKRGKWKKALTGYRNSARLFTSQVKKGGALRVAVIDELNDKQISENKDVFSGLTRALWELHALDLKTSSRASKEYFFEALEAAQWAWRTSAGNALGKMAARLGAGDSKLAVRVRELQEASKQIAVFNKRGSELLIAMSKAQRESPGWTELNRNYWLQNQKLGPQRRKLELQISKLQQMRRPLQRQIKRLQDEAQKQRLQSADDSIKRQVEALQKKKTSVEQKIAKASKPLDDIRARVERQHGFERKRQAVLAQLQPLERTATRMNKNIIRDFPGYVELVDPQPMRWRDIQKLLTDDEALLVYLVGEERSFVFALNKTGSDWAQINLGAKKLSQIVAKLRDGLDPTGQIRPTRGLQVSDASGQDLLEAKAQGLPFDLQVSHDLYKQLVAPVASILAGAKHVLLVPAGALTSLPFQVLVSKKPAKALPDYEGYRKAAWLIRDHAVSVLPSVSSLKALRRFERKGRAPKPFIGYGDPILEGPGSGGNRSAPVNEFYDGNLANIEQVRRLSPLPDTARELNTIAERLGVPSSQVKLRAQATETDLKATKLSNYRLIHFATHGLLAGDLKGLAEPALVLTPPAKASALDDGLLTASEAAQLDLRADWVVMSACNTASGGQPGAEALSGLARAFFYAGARALLVSHWPVYSQAATELTTVAFDELRNNPKINRAEALRRSMLTLIDNRDSPDNAHPSLWAPFILVGEGGDEQSAGVR